PPPSRAKIASSSGSAFSPAARSTALRSHCRPNTSSSPPTTTRRTPIGIEPTAGPSAAPTTESATPPAPTPYTPERQLRVVPTASTIVSASTASTVQARNTETASAHWDPDIVAAGSHRRVDRHREPEHQ